VDIGPKAGAMMFETVVRPAIELAGRIHAVPGIGFQQVAPGRVDLVFVLARMSEN